ncbi:hypothetical protein NP233_g4540 [Leucocoprinus birnbaumii]|uniref:ubiquitinyl hydrolase 1 n=1 Tax=Leucocoprinus birnbaumii TaxID=56174 RepID=A0AAD5VX70_9AGAR|nr:hypothetical protein NP233_g4540 [Leucocoprinus birnbaumii]
MPSPRCFSPACYEPPQPQAPPVPPQPLRCRYDQQETLLWPRLGCWENLTLVVKFVPRPLLQQRAEAAAAAALRTAELAAAELLAPTSTSPPTHIMGSISHPSSSSHAQLTTNISHLRNRNLVTTSRRSNKSTRNHNLPSRQTPTDIVEKALDSRTPPLSPVTHAVALPSRGKVQRQQIIGEDVGVVVESENVIEVTDNTEGVLTIPGSPVLTSTSLSVSAPAVKENEEAVAAATSSEVITGGEDEEVKVAATESTATVTPTAGAPTTSTDAKAEATTTTMATATVSAAPAPAPSKPSAQIVGISLRLVLLSQFLLHIKSTQLSPNVLSSWHLNPSTFILHHTLRTSHPRRIGKEKRAPEFPEKIRTRGLINSGNMCFANAVLQVLVYCSPFQRLFIELGKLLISHNASSSSSSAAAAPVGTSTMVNGVTVTQLPSATTNNANAKQQKSQTPFIDATVKFLKEFIEDAQDPSSSSSRKRKTDGGGFSLQQPSKKGKERELFSAKDFEESGEGEDKDEWSESFLPSYVYDAMKEKKRFESMRGGQQEDAEEFLGFYLDTLEEELLHIQNSLAPPPPPSSSAAAAKTKPVEEKEEPEPPEEDGWLEVGKKNRTIVTRTKDSVLVEDWRSLRLDIQRDSIHTIQDALAHITHPQPIQMTHPSKPGITIDASQRVLIDSLPPVLVLHVKRFCYDTTVGGVVKVMKQVRFDPELEIGSDMMAPSGKRAQPTKYRLFGAIYHHGHSASGGHYTLDVLHPNRYPGAKIREGWVRIDDELVSDLRPEDVFDAWEKEKDEMRNAYLLFYRRIRNV